MVSLCVPFDEPGSSVPWLGNLDSVKDGLPKPLEIFEFCGPYTAHCFGYPYETLTTFGVKKECAPAPGPLVWNICEAWHAYKLTLLSYIGQDALQVAWRAVPTAQQTSRGDWEIYSRLYVWRGDR